MVIAPPTKIPAIVAMRVAARTKVIKEIGQEVKKEMRVVDFLKLSISYEPERVLATEIYLHTFRRHWYIC